MKLFSLLSTISLRSLVTVLVGLIVSASSTSQAVGQTVILSTDFDSLADGAVTAATLDTVTTGGTWSLNTTRDATYIIEDDGGDKALLADDTTGTGGANNGLIDFFTIDLDTPLTFSATDVATVDFTTATRRTGNNKALRYEFFDSNDALLSDITWAQSGAIFVTGNGSPGSSPFFFTSPWDADGAGRRDVSISFDGTNSILDFNGVTGTVPIFEPLATDLASIVVSSDFLDSTARGVYFDNLEVSTGEPATGLTGDFNGDGDVDIDDLDEYNGNIGAAAEGDLAALDLDENGTVDASDFAQHYTDLVETSNGQVGTVPGDANLDGTVDVLGDAAILVNNLNSASTSWGQGDFNGDGTVDVLSDAAALVNNIGTTNEPAAGAPATSAVPEPGSLSLLAIATVGLVTRRKRG